MDQGIIYTLVGLGLVLIVFAIVNIAARLQDFCRELRYLNAEIARTSGAEQAQWKRRKKRHMLSLIPFYRYFKK